MDITPHCDELNVEAPKRWSAYDRRLMDGAGIIRQAVVSDFVYEGAEAGNLRKSYSINQMALLTACMEATPFGETCRDKVNEVRWDHERSEKHLIKTGFLSKVNGEVCVTYPQIEFKSQDQQ